MLVLVNLAIHLQVHLLLAAVSPKRDIDFADLRCAVLRLRACQARVLLMDHERRPI